MKTTEKIEALNEQLHEIDKLRQESHSIFSSKHTKWSADTKRCIGSIFGADHEYLKEFDSISYAPSAIALDDDAQRRFDHLGYLRGLASARKLLSTMIDELSERSQKDTSTDTPKHEASSNNQSFSNKGKTMKITPARIFISVPGDHGLQPDQLAIKQGVLDLIKSVGFEPQEFGVSGDFSQIAWNFDNVQYILGRCQGVVILGLIRWDVWDAQNQYRFNTVYNHYEGALALAKHIPTFILMHADVYQGGIAYKGGGQFIVNLPDLVTPSWLQTDKFLPKFNTWVDLVNKRHHVFFGYSTQAMATAILVKNYLTQKGVSVMDWAVDFHPAHPIMDEIERAAKSCMGGIFLFTKDDEIVIGDTKSAAPRDNVIFEAGYFMHAKGIDKTLIIREEGAKMPADIGGHIYLPLQDRNDIRPIETDLEKFIVNNL